jgi:hypothetical protein
MVSDRKDGNCRSYHSATSHTYADIDCSKCSTSIPFGKCHIFLGLVHDSGQFGVNYLHMFIRRHHMYHFNATVLVKEWTSFPIENLKERR